MPKYNVAYRTEVVVHVQVDADDEKEAERLAGPALYRQTKVLHPRLEAAVADNEDAEVGEEWHLARITELPRRVGRFELHPVPKGAVVRDFAEVVPTADDR